MRPPLLQHQRHQDKQRKRRQRSAFEATAPNQVKKYERSLQRFREANPGIPEEAALQDFHRLEQFINGDGERKPWTQATLCRDMLEAARLKQRKHSDRRFPVEDLKKLYNELQGVARQRRQFNTQEKLTREGKFLPWETILRISTSSLREWMEEQKANKSMISTVILVLLTSIPPSPGVSIATLTLATSFQEYVKGKNVLFFCPTEAKWRVKITTRKKGCLLRPVETVLQDNRSINQLLQRFTSDLTRNRLGYPQTSNYLFYRGGGRPYLENNVTSAAAWTLRLQTVIRASALKFSSMSEERIRMLRISTEALRRAYCTYISQRDVCQQEQLKIQRSMNLSRRAIEQTYNLGPAPPARAKSVFNKQRNIASRDLVFDLFSSMEEQQ